MKLSTQKILGIEVGVGLLWAVLLLVPMATLREYLQIGVLGCGILVSWWLLGWARPQAREGRLAGLVQVLAALLFQIIWFVFFGLKLGFVWNVYSWNWMGILQVFLPAILVIVGEEILRGQMIAKGHESKVVLGVTAGVLTVLEVIWVLPIYDLTVARDAFEILMIVGFPAVLKNVLLTYVAFWYDYRSNIIYRLIMEMPMFMLPVLPNVDNYLTTMFVAGLMLVLVVVLTKMHGQKVQRNKIEKATTEKEAVWKKRAKYGAIGVVSAAVVIYMALMCGLFKYHFMAVGSGSMEPNIARGDMVLVEKSDRYNEMKEGEVLVYRRGNVVIVHRINDVKEIGGRYRFRTKGDANDSVDNWMVDQDDVIGIAKSKIMAFGYPTLWLNELFNGGKS